MGLKLRYDNDTKTGHLVVEPGVGFVFEDSLETAVLVSLFTWAESTDSDTRKRVGKGWWGDSYPDANALPLAGSRLYLLERRKVTDATLADAKRYAEESLAWMVTDGVASKVEAVATKVNDSTIELNVGITRPQELAPTLVGPWDVSLTTMELV